MNVDTTDYRDHSYLIGFMAGALVGTGLTLWLAPRVASELRQRLTASSRDFGNRAAERYQQVSKGVGEAVDELTREGQDVRDDVADRVARGAHEVERFAKAAKTDRLTEIRKRSAAADNS